MTTKITYENGYCFDMTDAEVAAWAATETRANMLDADATLSCLDDDVYMIEGKPDAGADEYVYYEKDITDIGTTSYPYCLVRWKTSAASNGMQAKIFFDYTVGDQTVALGYSQTWTTTKIELTAGKTLDKIRIYADDEPNAVAAGTFYVYYDFILIGKQFEFPYIAKDGISGGTHLHFEREDGYLDALNRDGAIIQEGGLASPLIMLEGDMDTRAAWLTSPVGSALYSIFYPNPFLQTQTDLFQWLETEMINCKVVPVDLDLYQVPGTGKRRLWTLTLKLYSRASGKASSVGGFNWLGF